MADILARTSFKGRANISDPITKLTRLIVLLHWATPDCMNNGIFYSCSSLFMFRIFVQSKLIENLKELNCFRVFSDVFSVTHI